MHWLLPGIDPFLDFLQMKNRVSVWDAPSLVNPTSKGLQWNTAEVAVSKYRKQEVAQLSLTMIRAKSIKSRRQAVVTQ